MKIPTLTWT